MCGTEGEVEADGHVLLASRDIGHAGIGIDRGREQRDRIASDAKPRQAGDDVVRAGSGEADGVVRAAGGEAGSGQPRRTSSPGSVVRGQALRHGIDEAEQVVSLTGDALEPREVVDHQEGGWSAAMSMATNLSLTPKLSVRRTPRASRRRRDDATVEIVALVGDGHGHIGLRAIAGVANDEAVERRSEVGGDRGRVVIVRSLKSE